MLALDNAGIASERAHHHPTQSPLTRRLDSLPRGILGQMQKGLKKTGKRMAVLSLGFHECGIMQR